MSHIEENNMKNKVILGLIWKLIEKTGAQGIQFIISIILARLLLPEEYGIIALITIFLNIANIFIQSGFSSAIIQKKEVDEVDCDSVFYFNLIISIIAYFILYMLSPIISDFYKNPILSSVLRVQSITLIIGGLNAIQNAIIQRKMQFKKLFIVSLVAIIIQGLVGIFMAYKNYGVWSLVISNLVGSIVTTIILWFITSWRPKLNFSIIRLKSMFKFGSRLLLSSLIDIIYNNLYSLIIGKKYDQEMLAYYNRGQNIPNILVTNINSSIDGVLFPALSTYQDDKKGMKMLVRRSIVTSSFIVFPIMFGLFAISKPLTIILLTDKWIDSVPFMKLSCIMYAIWPIHTANLQAIKAMGRSDVFFKLEVIKKILGIVIIVITIPFGVYTMMIGCVINSILCTFINAYPNKHLLEYDYFQQIKDILPSLILSIAMSIIISCISIFDLSNFVIILLQMILGICVYVLGAWIFKFECFLYIINNIKYYINKSRKSKSNGMI